MSKPKRLLESILNCINAPPKDKDKRAKHAKVDSEVEKR